MPLTYDKLIKFDLFEQSEQELKKEQYPELFSILNDINSINKFIEDTPAYPGSTSKISRAEMVMSIGSTLAIEGILLDKDEIEESIRKAEMNDTLLRKEQEAENSHKVYQFIIGLVNAQRENNSKFIYDEATIKEIHNLFTRGLNYMSNEPGKYRNNFSTTFGEPRKIGLCKTESEVQEAMEKFVEWLNKENTGSFADIALIKAIMAHYYLSEIHPFGDGNGRTARALEALILHVNGINDYCFWSLANFWSANKNEYLAHLGNITQNCNPWDFVLWGLKGFLQEINRIQKLVLKKIKRLMLKDYTQWLLRDKKSQSIKINRRIEAIVDFLVKVDKIEFPDFLKTPQIAGLYINVSRMTKKRDLTKLKELELIKYEEHNDILYIMPNFNLLDHLVYRV